MTAHQAHYLNCDEPGCLKFWPIGIEGWCAGSAKTVRQRATEHGWKCHPTLGDFCPKHTKAAS